MVAQGPSDELQAVLRLRSLRLHAGSCAAEPALAHGGGHADGGPGADPRPPGVGACETRLQSQGLLSCPMGPGVASVLALSWSWASQVPA